MKNYTYLRGLVVAPIFVALLMILVSYIFGPTAPKIMHWFMFWYGGPVVGVTFLSIVMYMPILFLSWSWFKNANSKEVEQKIWLFPVPCVLAVAVIMFGVLLPEHALVQTAWAFFSAYVYMGLGMGIYYVGKKAGLFYVGT